MKQSCVAILGAYTEFSELYVRHLCSEGHHVALLDLDPKKAQQLKDYAQKNPKHFTNLDVSFHTLDEANIFDSLIAKFAEIKASYNLAGLLNIKEKLVIEGAKAAEVLGLPGTGIKAATVSRNKYLQRALFADSSFAPQSKIFQLSDALQNLPERGVLKPINEHGSVGVVLWRSSEQISSVKEALKDFSPQALFLLEELIEGNEYSLEAWISQSKVVTHHVTRKGTLPAENIEFPVENSHEIFAEDSLEEKTKEQLSVILNRIISQTHVQNAILHLEFKVSASGVKIMEWCVRNPGDRIMDLYYYSQAFNPYALYADICTGKTNFKVQKHQKRTKQIYFSARESLNSLDPTHPLCYWPTHSKYIGFVRGKNGETLSAEEIVVHELGVLLKEEDLTKAPIIRDSFSRHAYVILSYPPKTEPSNDGILIEKSIKGMSLCS
ncbi:MAG: ATP-grasp domain-containing protein [Bdellovibrionota bacterium]